MTERDSSADTELSDELEYDGEYEIDEEQEEEIEPPTRAPVKAVSAWRRIEALRERQQLKRELGFGDDELDALLSEF